jgi:hexulose-6-phosphate isomerase
MTTDRREFLTTSLGTLAAAGLLGSASLPSACNADDAKANAAKKPKLKKAIKFSMVQDKNLKTIEEKFKLAKSCGFEGLEIDSPNSLDPKEVVKARDAVGIDIHGVIDSIHWNTRLSDPDEKVRAKGLDGLKTALRDCKTYGGTTALLVPGAVRDKEHENFDQVWERSTAEVKKAMPLAKELGVKIAIETVWNNFITSPEQMIKYVDQFNDPIVGTYFDISNMIKFGVAPADWIRKLGKRMLKFDFKGYSKAKQWVNIGEGDEDWPEVLKALAEVGYNGFATAEVGGGGEAHLRDVSKRMDKILGLG